MEVIIPFWLSYCVKKGQFIDIEYNNIVHSMGLYNLYWHLRARKIHSSGKFVSPSQLSRVVCAVLSTIQQRSNAVDEFIRPILEKFSSFQAALKVGWKIPQKPKKKKKLPLLTDSKGKC